MEIKLEATTAHLWFEEIISGDRHEDIEVVWKHLDQADWYTRAMLEGGTNYEGTFIPLDDAEMRQNILDVRIKLSEFKNITVQRLAAIETSGSGTDIDQNYDEIFNSFIAEADETEHRLQEIMAQDLRRFRLIQTLLIVVSSLLIFVVGIVFYRFEHRRTKDAITIHHSNEKLQQHIQELRVLNKMSQQVSSSLSLDQVVQTALDVIIAAVNPDLALFFLRDGDNLKLQGVGPVNSKYSHDETPVHRVGECLCGLAVRESKPMYSSDISNDPRCTWEECKKAGLRSFAALPLLSGDEVIGILGIASGTQRMFEEQNAFLQTLSNYISTGLQNALLHIHVQCYAEELEAKVAERTTELTEANASLEEKNKEYERFNRVFVEREFRIKELRDRIKKLEGSRKIDG